MPDLSFHVQNAAAVANAAVPTLALKLRVVNDCAGEPIHTVVLRCQIQIEAPRRRYDAREQEKPVDLFGEPHRWGQTLRSLLWTHTSAVVPGFTGDTAVDLPVPCTYDFNLAATRYVDALEDGEVPLALLFSGTVFYAAENGALQVAPISWEREAKFRLPVSVWRDMMDLYYPDTAYLPLRKDLFDRLQGHKSQHGLLTWEQVIESLLDAAGEGVTP